jgi:hypothetical protein
MLLPRACGHPLHSLALTMAARIARIAAIPSRPDVPTVAIVV